MYIEEEKDPYIRSELERIEKILHDWYLTRMELSRQIMYPKNTNRKVVVESNLRGSGFWRNMYDEQVLSKYMLREEFEKIL